MGAEVFAVALGGLSGGLSFAQAEENNKAAKRAADQQKAANRVAANRQDENLAREWAQLEGSLRATSAARGAAGSASAQALSQFAGFAATSQSGAVATNLRLANQQADQRAAAAYQNPLMAGLQGTLQGFLLGTQLSSFFPSNPVPTGAPPAGSIYPPPNAYVGI